MDTLDNELFFVGKDGKEYKFVALEINELIKFTRWVQYKPYRDALDAQLHPEILQKILEECKSGLVKELIKPDNISDDEVKSEDLLEKEFTISFMSSVVQRQMLTFEGIKRLMELSLEMQGLNPKLILNDKIIGDYTEKFLPLCGIVLKDKEENPTNPNQK